MSLGWTLRVRKPIPFPVSLFSLPRDCGSSATVPVSGLPAAVLPSMMAMDSLSEPVSNSPIITFLCLLCCLFTVIEKELKYMPEEM